ncbi:TIM barrel protein [Novosphingobium sp. FKTRR1]|uniref:sugar phosphate isomerase/epimerase family protein n=1 Tax=Novosphingobium sp. FKTRR1 TaxID=2879118 RepID=UPI001CF0A627
MNPLSLNTFNGSPWVGGAGDLGRWADAAAAAGFALLGPDCPSIDAWLATGRTMAGLSRRLRDAGIGCEIVGVCAMLDGSAQQRAALAQATRHAQALGANFLQVNVSAPDAAARLAAVEQAATAVAGTGLRLALEYMPITPLCTLAETLAIVTSIGTDTVGALVDNWHHAHDPQGWETLADAPLDAIAYVEFDDAQPAPANASLDDETMHRRTFPGTGVLECARFASLCRARGYNGVVSVEVLDRAWRDRPLSEFADTCFATTRPHWA